MDEGQNLEEILRQEAERINSDRGVGLEKEGQSFGDRIIEMAHDPQRAKSAAELLENISDLAIKKSLLILAGCVPGTENYRKALLEVPEDFRKVADRAMSPIQNARGEQERRLCDLILFNHSLIDEATKLGIDFEGMSDSVLLERMADPLVMETAKLKRYKSQEEFTEKFSKRMRQMMERRALEELQGGNA